MTRISFASALLLVVICSFSAAPAKAAVMSSLTGDFTYETVGGIGPMQGFFYGLNGYFALYPVETYRTQTYCDQWGDCVSYISGTIVGGTGTVTLYLPNNAATITLNVVGLRGSTIEAVGNMCMQGCYDDYQWSNYVFRGFWSNGWYSTFSGSEYWDIYVGGGGGVSIRTQTTPEPASLALLGSGAIGLIGYGRKRR